MALTFKLRLKMIWLLAEWKLVLCGLLAAALGYFVIANTNLHAENDKQKIQISQYAAAQTENLKTITDLQADQKSLSDQFEKDQTRSLNSFKALQQQLEDIKNANDAPAAAVLNAAIDSMLRNGRATANPDKDHSAANP